MTAAPSIDYAAHLQHLSELLAEAKNLLDVQSTVVGYLHQSIPHYTWVGFYMKEGAMLALGPFRGKPTPHVLIPLSQGICGAAVRENQTLIVDDVHSDPRYLACSIETRSEIVIPLRKAGEVVGELDLDSDLPAAFTAADQEFLEAVAHLVESRL